MISATAQKAVIISSPSGGGKTTVVHDVLSRVPRLGFSVSACTRKRRPHEQAGVDYHFLSSADFRQKISEKAFIEWEEVYEGHYYGTLASELQALRAADKHVIFDVNVQGAQRLKAYFGQRALSIFLQPPSVEALEERLRARHTEGRVEMSERLSRAHEELSYASRFDVCVRNERVEVACQEVWGHIAAFLAQ